MKYSHKRVLCNKMAKVVFDASHAMGFDVELEDSNVSASRYVYIYRQNDTEPKLKVRISDHEDKYYSSDLCLYFDDDTEWNREVLIKGIEKIAASLGVEVPAKFSREAFSERSEKAKKAALSRRKNKSTPTEGEMLNRIVAALHGERLFSPVAAGKVVDAFYPQIPRAQRQRLAHGASSQVKKEKGI